MHLDRKNTLLVALLLSTTMAAKCITINEDAAVAVNIDDITGTYAIPPAVTSILPPANCVTKNSADYIDPDFADIRNARLVDVKVQTIGAFAGSVSNGTVTANGTTVLRYSGPWATFNTEQSLLTSSAMTTEPAGVAVIVNAITNSQPVTLCATGTFSQPTTTGLSLKVSAFAQVDAVP
jgi:hypothetical protein